MNVKTISLWAPLRISLEIHCQNVAKYIKAKILTTHIKAVRISLGAPDRAQTISLYLIVFQTFTNYL